VANESLCDVCTTEEEEDEEDEEVRHVVFISPQEEGEDESEQDAGWAEAAPSSFVSVVASRLSVALT
jgi:hypothetical protein